MVDSSSVYIQGDVYKSKQSPLGIQTFHTMQICKFNFIMHLLLLALCHNNMFRNIN